MAEPSYEDITPEEEEVAGVPTVLPLLSEQELRRVLEDLQGDEPTLELWEGERDVAEEVTEEEAEAELAAEAVQAVGDLETQISDTASGKSEVEPEKSKSTFCIEDPEALVGFAGPSRALGVGPESAKRSADAATSEAETSKFTKFRERLDVTTEEETTEEEEESLRSPEAGPSTSGLLLFSTLGGGRQEEGEASISWEGGAGGAARHPVIKRKRRRQRREPGDVLKRGDLLEYLVEDGDDEQWFKVEVMGKGKAGGRNRNYINLRYHASIIRNL